MVYLIGKHLGGLSAFHYNTRLSKKHFILLFSSALVPIPILPAAATNRFFFLKSIPRSPELPNKPLCDEIALIHTIHPSRMTRINIAADRTCPWILASAVKFPYFLFFQLSLLIGKTLKFLHEKT